MNWNGAAKPKRAHVVSGLADEPSSQSPRVASLALGQGRILELIATGSPMGDALDALLLFLEQQAPGMLGSILLLDPDGVHLRHGAAPSLPEAYVRAIDGAAIGPCAGSCGTAAYRAQQVLVTDIEVDPLWADYRDLARPHGLRACWSTPIFGSAGRVLATFAMYFREPGSPTTAHQQMVAMATHVAAIAIIKELRERAVRESEERYRLINLATNDAVWDWDVRKNTLWWNDGVQRLFGYDAADVTNDLAWWVARVHADDRERVHDSLQAAADTDANSWHEEYRFLRKDGTYADVQDRGYVMRDESGTTVRMIGMMQDVSERRQAQRRIEYLAYHEPVTRLPNRAAMQRELAEAVEQADDHGGELSLVLLNLNYFRDINESLGHQNGDLLLHQVAERLRCASGSGGCVASLGGDEFAVLISQSPSSPAGGRALAAIRDCLQSPFELAGIPIVLDATLGVAVYPGDAATPELLWQHADVALRTAKERRDPCLYYHAGIDHYDPTRLALIGELRDAIANDQLVLYYQPIVDLRSGRTVGLEALVRWAHPTRGLILPDAFLPLAERTDLISPLTIWTAAGAIRQAMALARAGSPLELSINLSPRSLHDPAFCRDFIALVHAAGFPPRQLTLEITETAIMADPARARCGLAELRDAGMRLAMDDFGVGQSSLTYLRELPITEMKIDKAFLIDFDQPWNAALVRSAIDLARNLGLGVTAEGIEHEATFGALRDLACDLGQGYFFSRPMPIDALITWLGDSRWSPGRSLG